MVVEEVDKELLQMDLMKLEVSPELRVVPVVVEVVVGCILIIILMDIQMTYKIQVVEVFLGKEMRVEMDIT